jgi:hypothetical protein
MRKFLSSHLKALPYQVHTNRELGLMLRGVKPLAAFADYEGHFPEVVLRYLRMFDRHVAAGRFVRRDLIIDKELGQLRCVYFALPKEEWRIQAMIDLRARPGKWTREMEREEGELLGYTTEQNEIWLSRSRFGSE